MSSEWGLRLLSLFVPIVLSFGLAVALYLFIRWQRARNRYSPISEHMLRTPAQQLEAEHAELSDNLFFPIILIVTLPVAMLVSANTSTIGWALVFLVDALAAWYLFKTLKRAIVLRLAIDGEQYTGLELNYLMREGAWVFHDIPYAYGNIDHVVVSTGGVLAIETKTIRKPGGNGERSREYEVTFDGSELVFPHFSNTSALEQARRHAQHIQDAIRSNLGVKIPVTPVVALPGWYVKRSTFSDVWVINPKRGKSLVKKVKQLAISPEVAERIANYVESVVRSIPAGSKKLDPDASNYYDFWNKRRFEERKLGG